MWLIANEHMGRDRSRQDWLAEQFERNRARLRVVAYRLALLVILETLAPDERLAFVLHDMFAVSLRTSPRSWAVLQRRRDSWLVAHGAALQGSTSVPDTSAARHREVIEAFLAAARTGDFEALLAVLDPDVVLRADPATLRVVRGARAVAERALTFSRLAQSARLALVNGMPGIISWLPDGRRWP